MRFVHGFAALLAVVGILVASPAAASPVMSQGKIDTLLLSDEDISSIVGLPMRQAGDVYPKPARSGPLPDRDDCRSFVESDVNLWTGDFTAFRQVTRRDDPDNPQFSTSQYLATYPNATAAAGTFRRAFAPDLAGRCGSATVTDTAGGIWRLDNITITADRAGWKNAYIRDGEDTTWRCANEIRQKGNVMFLEVECQFGNGSPLVAQMARVVGSRIPS